MDNQNGYHWNTVTKNTNYVTGERHLSTKSVDTKARLNSTDKFLMKFSGGEFFYTNQVTKKKTKKKEMIIVETYYILSHFKINLFFLMQTKNKQFF